MRIYGEVVGAAEALAAGAAEGQPQVLNKIWNISLLDMVNIWI